MPLYEYQCDNGHRFEVIQKFSDAPLQVCSTCGAPVQKLQASPAFQFKGSGWYITDYARKDGASGGETKSKDSAAGGDKTDAGSTKAESKSESSTDSGSKTESSPAPSKP